VVGWKSKKMLKEIDLVDVIIDLRKQLAMAEGQRDNALNVVATQRKKIERLEDALWGLAASQDPTVRKIADAALKDDE
jgi:hypothetical protein